MSGAADVVKTPWGKKVLPSKSSLKSAPLIGLLAGAAVVAPFIVGGMRSERRFNEDDAPMPKALTDPLPPILEFTPSPDMGQATMMGQQPVAGSFAKKEMMRRTGAMAGPDVASPNIMTPSGVSVIDGKHVADLNSEGKPSGLGLS
jgi:hypothetical protein